MRVKRSGKVRVPTSSITGPKYVEMPLNIRLDYKQTFFLPAQV